MSLIVYKEPVVTLIGETRFLPPEHINWRSDTPVDAQEIVEFGGRLCYLSFGEESGIEGHKTIRGRSNNRDYLENILRTKHGSVTEHANYTFLFEGVSRSFTHELVRHRHLSFSQLSQRYVDESNVAFVAPPQIVDSGPAVFGAWVESCRAARDAYKKLLDTLLPEGDTSTIAKKRAREAARAVLPNSTETKIVVTGNARAWRHFLVLRGAQGADREIRKVACAVAQHLTEHSPDLFQDVEVAIGSDGLAMVNLKYGDV